MITHPTPIQFLRALRNRNFFLPINNSTKFKFTTFVKFNKEEQGKKKRGGLIINYINKFTGYNFSLDTARFFRTDKSRKQKQSCSEPLRQQFNNIIIADARECGINCNESQLTEVARRSIALRGRNFRSRAARRDQ